MSDKDAQKESLVTWVDPPEPRPSKAALVAEELKERPNTWALIDTTSEGLNLGVWWTPLYNSSDFEVLMIRKGPGLFPANDIYARYIGKKARSRV